MTEEEKAVVDPQEILGRFGGRLDGKPWSLADRTGLFPPYSAGGALITVGEIQQMAEELIRLREEVKHD